MKRAILSLPESPLGSEKVEALAQKAADFLGIDRADVLVLPAGVGLQLVDAPAHTHAKKVPTPQETGK